MKRMKILAILLASVVAASSMGGAVYAEKEQGADLIEQVAEEATQDEGETGLVEGKTGSVEGETGPEEADPPLLKAPPVASGSVSTNEIHLSVSEIEIDNDKAFEDFAMMILGLEGNQGISLLSSTTARDRLDSEEQAIYDIMYDHIAGEDGIAIKGGDVGISIEFEGSDWNDDSKSEKVESVVNAYKAISYDCAEYMYWHSGVYQSELEYDEESLIITFSPFASPEYGTGNSTIETIEKEIDGEIKKFTYTYYDAVDPSAANKLLSVKRNVDKIINANKSKSPYDKLKAYGDAISKLVEYDFDAVGHDNPSSDDYDPAWSSNYIEPWQLINVFDGDPSTNVVCEGYSKAFKYLCDLGAPEVDCILVTGVMDGGTGAGGHMWNNVRMDDGRMYLVDITNSDDGDAMATNYPLFLRPYDSGKKPDSCLDGFALKTLLDGKKLELSYQYYSQTWADEYNDGSIGGHFDMNDMFGSGWLTLSSIPYDRTTPPSPGDQDDDRSDNDQSENTDTDKKKDTKPAESPYTINQIQAIAILGGGATPETYGQKMGSFSKDARNKAMETDYKFFQAYATWSGSNYESISNVSDAIMNIDNYSFGTMPDLKLAVTGLDAYAQLQNSGFISGLLNRIGISNPVQGPGMLNISSPSAPGIVANNAQNYPTIVIKTDKWISFDKETLTAFEKSGKAVLVIYKYNGEIYQFLIPAGYPASTLANAQGYAGFLYIKHIMESSGIVVTRLAA